MTAAAAAPAIQPATDIAAEQATLGALLLDREAIIAVVDRLTPEMFYLETHRLLYQACVDCYRKRIPPDPQTVASRLTELGKLEDVGGLPALFDLAAACPTAYHIEHYAEQVIDCAHFRALAKVGGQIAALGFQRAGMKHHEAILQATHLLQQTALTAIRPQTDSIPGAYGRLLERMDKGMKLGTPTGFADYDRLTGGIQAGSLDILAARPGVGKTALALTMIYSLVRRNHPVLMFSLEMSLDELLQRLISIHTGIRHDRIRNGRIGSEELTVLIDTEETFSRFPLVVDDTSGLTITDLRARAIRHQAQHGTPVLIVVDYLQLMTPTTTRKANRNEEVAEMSRGLKLLAKDLKCGVLALAQLNRDVEKRMNKVPQLSDLRDSGAVEQDADRVVFIYREDMYDKDTDKKGIAELHLAKHRAGPTGAVSLFFDGATTRFRDLAPYQSPEGY